MKILISKVCGHEGECSPTWLNKNSVFNRFDNGVTGFFKSVKEVSFLFLKFKVKYGPEFHGIINSDKIVTSTKNEY